MDQKVSMRGRKTYRQQMKGIRFAPYLLSFTFAASLAISDDKSTRLGLEEAAKLFSISNDEKPTEGGKVGTPAVVPTGYRELIKRVTPTVVSVFPERMLAKGGDDTDPLARFFGTETEGGENGNEKMGLGSGVILSADGWIVTNSHVVHLPNGKLADSVSVELHDRRLFQAAIIGADPLTDVALLKIEVTALDFLPMGDSAELMTGDLVFAIGNPFKLGMTATMGMVSATQRTSLNLNGNGGFESFIQTDAAINPGNSGGALVDAHGRLVGINTAIYGPGGGNVGIGFAIPTRLMSKVVSGLARDGEMKRGFFGLQTDEVDPEKAKAAGAPAIAGAIVTELMVGGPAEKSGLEVGDVITNAAGLALETRGDLRVELSCLRPGEGIELIITRKGATKSITLTAGETPLTAKGTDSTFMLDSIPGVKFRVSVEGLEITEIDKGKKGTGDQLTVGMIIDSINGKQVKSEEDAASALKKGVNKVVTRLGGSNRTLALRLE